MNNDPHNPTEDHDLLIRIDEKLNLLVKKNSDHETRLRRLELWGAMAIGALTLIQFVGFGYILSVFNT